MKKLVFHVSNLCLGLFLADALVSLLDDSLLLFFGLPVLTVIRGMLALLAILMGMLVYGLIGLTPLVPKRVFLPVTLFLLFAQLFVVPVLIFCHRHVQLVGWCFSLAQVAVGLGVVYGLTGGLKIRWPLVAEERFGTRRFSWLNTSGFVLANVFVLAPAVVLFLSFCLSQAVTHFSAGFLALSPRGLTVQVREYVRNDGKTIRLIPMAHIGEPEFYRQLSQSFPSNSIILMEGVTDEKHLLTNGLSYKQTATSLGLAEQDEEFVPTQGEIVPADVDVSDFSTNTIDFLNLVMLVHARGLRPEFLLKLAELSPSGDFERLLVDDLLTKRNRRVLDEIQARLPQTENIMVPWGVAHMPGIAEQIQKSGFRLNDSREYRLIRFGSRPKKN